RREHLRGIGGVGEGGPAPAVAVEVHQAGQEQPVMGEGARRPVLRGVRGRSRPEDVAPADEQERVGDEALLGHGGAVQGALGGERGGAGGGGGGHGSSRSGKPAPGRAGPGRERRGRKGGTATARSQNRRDSASSMPRSAS